MRAAALTGLGAHRPARRDGNAEIAARHRLLRRVDPRAQRHRHPRRRGRRRVRRRHGHGRRRQGARRRRRRPGRRRPGPARHLLHARPAAGRLAGGRLAARRAPRRRVRHRCRLRRLHVRPGARRRQRAGRHQPTTCSSSAPRSCSRWSTRTTAGTAFLFGDGAGAAVVSVAPDREDDGIGRGRLGPRRRPARPARHRRHAAAAEDGGPGDLPLGHHRPCPTSPARPASAPASSSADLAAFVPHQANLRITESVVKSLAPARRRSSSPATSSTAATPAPPRCPLALARLAERGAVRRGDAVLLLGFGAGLTAAGQVVRCP